MNSWTEQTRWDLWAWDCLSEPPAEWVRCRRSLLWTEIVRLVNALVHMRRKRTWINRKPPWLHLCAVVEGMQPGNRPRPGESTELRCPVSQLTLRARVGEPLYLRGV